MRIQIKLKCTHRSQTFIPIPTSTFNIFQIIKTNSLIDSTKEIFLYHNYYIKIKRSHFNDDKVTKPKSITQEDAQEIPEINHAE